MEIRHEKSGAGDKFVVNGKEYTRFEDVPSEYQQFFEDKNGDGTPDAMEFKNMFRTFEQLSNIETTDFTKKSSPGNNRNTKIDYTSGDGPKSGSRYLMLKIMFAIAIGTALAIAFYAMK